MIHIAESRPTETKPVEVPSPEGLREAARRQATDLKYVMRCAEVRESELLDAASAIKDRESDLDQVPGEVRAWVESHRGQAVGEIAAYRKLLFQVHASAKASGERSPEPGLWVPLSGPQREVLGATLSQQLLEEAEYWRGRAEQDEELAARLNNLDAEGLPALGDLRDSVRKLHAAAEVHAAAHELERRRLIESARSKAEAGQPAGFALPTSEGVPLKPPLQRHPDLLDRDPALLDRHFDALRAYSFLVAEQIKDLDSDALTHLANDTADAWSTEKFNPDVAHDQASLESSRLRAFRQRLAALRRIGTGRTRFGPAVDRQLQRLRETGNALKLKREEPGSAARFVRGDFVRAALHDAAHRVLAERAAELHQAQAAAQPQREDPVPSYEALRRAAELRAVEERAGLAGLKDPDDLKDLRDLAEQREGLLSALNFARREVREWGKTSWDAAAREVAGARVRAPISAAENPWFPLGTDQRAVLGDRTSVLLLEQAAHYMAEAKTNPKLAEELKGLRREALGGLTRPANRVEAAAMAIAARQERDRLGMMEAAEQGAKAQAVKIVQVETKVGGSNAEVKTPLERHKNALVKYGEPLQAHARELAASVDELSTRALHSLATELKDPYSREFLVAELALQQGSVEVSRDAALAEYLKAVSAGANRSAKETASRKWSQLTQAQSELENLRRTSGGLDQFIREHPEIALHDRVHAKLLEKALAREQSQQAAAKQQGPEKGRDAEASNVIDMASRAGADASGPDIGP